MYHKTEALLSESQHLAKIGSWEYDLKSGDTFWTEELYRIHELHVDPAIDHMQESLKCFDSESRAVLEAAFRQVCAEGEPYDLVLPFTTSRGNRLWVRTTARPIHENGILVRVIGNLMDITEQRLAQEQIRGLDRDLQDRITALEAVNKELEAFAYSVSHDLRAPQRHIDGFLELLEKKAGATLDQQSRHYLDNSITSAKKLGQLIEALQAFSRIGRQAMSVGEVALGDITPRVIAELEPLVEKRRIRWLINDLPVVRGDAPMLRVVLMNLISNALKFTRQEDPTIIQVGSESRAGEIVVYVRDNGVGFDQKYADKLFGVFQHLHRSDEFEGTGMGLAIVRRIIYRHGGRVWAEGRLGHGATFYFSLRLEHG
ncbi:PAS domain S-box protein [bacterium]|nr:PAS domain S-box protein [bacterium]